MGSDTGNKGENGSSSSVAKRNDTSPYSLYSPCSTRRLLNAPSMAIWSLVFLLLTAFASLQFYLPKAHSSCLCPENGPITYNSSAIGMPKVLSDGTIEYQITVVSDLDHDSKITHIKDTWRSFLRHGRFLFHPEKHTVQVVWDQGEATSLFSHLAFGGRSMELSDLVVFDGHLLTVDDRTGVVYRIHGLKDMVPWTLLNDGPGNTTKGFKAEWMTVKDRHLVVGGLGKEWTTADGVFQNYNPMWVKLINPSGEILHVDWTEHYKKLRRTIGIEFPGYMIHESGHWSDVHQKWFFLPRRESKETYSEVEDEHHGTNLLLIADEHFNTIEVRHIGAIGDGFRGFSAFHFLPGTEDQIIVALKSEERDGKAVASYLFVFRLADGKVLLDGQKFDGPYKFEGIILY